jgi:hypothetical protein
VGNPLVAVPPAAVPMLYRHLSARCAFILDDAHRSGERDLVACRLHPDLSVTRLPEGKGLVVLTRRT